MELLVRDDALLTLLAIVSLVVEAPAGEREPTFAVLLLADAPRRPVPVPLLVVLVLSAVTREPGLLVDLPSSKVVPLVVLLLTVARSPVCLLERTSESNELFLTLAKVSLETAEVSWLLFRSSEKLRTFDTSLVLVYLNVTGALIPSAVALVPTVLVPTNVVPTMTEVLLPLLELALALDSPVATAAESSFTPLLPFALVVPPRIEGSVTDGSTSILEFDRYGSSGRTSCR